MTKVGTKLKFSTPYHRQTKVINYCLETCLHCLIGT